MKVPEPLTDKHGYKYYELIPPVFRPATIQDYPKAFTQNRPFLIKRAGEEHYEIYRVKIPMNKKIVAFLEEGRVYLYEN